MRATSPRQTGGCKVIALPLKTIIEKLRDFRHKGDMDSLGGVGEKKSKKNDDQNQGVSFLSMENPHLIPRELIEA